MLSTVETKPSSRRRIVLGLGILAALCLVIAALPAVIANTPLRNVLITSALADPELKASVERASFGWFSPLTLDGLQIVRADGAAQIDIRRIATEQSWLRLWMALPRLGRIEIDQPRFDVLVSADRQTPEPETSEPPAELPELTAVLRGAEILVRTKHDTRPVVDLKPLDVTLDLQRTAAGPQLVVEPTTLLDHLPLTPALCNSGLQLVAPMLANSVDVDGQVSFELRKFVLPLNSEHDRERQLELTEIEGVVQMHQVSAGLKNPLLHEVAGWAARLVGRKMPDRVQLVGDSSLHFYVKQGRVYHEGLALMLPEVSSEMRLVTGGSVGLDETLDLTIQVQLPADLMGESPLGRRLSSKPLVLQVGGTVQAPKLGLPNGADWASGLAQLLGDGGELSPQERSLAASVLELIGQLTASRGEDSDDQAPTLLERIRVRRDARRAAEDLDAVRPRRRARQTPSETATDQ